MHYTTSAPRRATQTLAIFREFDIGLDATVLGGLPVTVCASIFAGEVDDMWLEVRGKLAPWVEKRMSRLEWDTLRELVADNIGL